MQKGKWTNISECRSPWVSEGIALYSVELFLAFFII